MLFRSKAKARDGFFIVSLAWILTSLIGAVPAFASGAIPSFIDSFFETCSGFTTTGASLIENIEIMPKSILLWRSCAVWLGGAGIILFTAFVCNIRYCGHSMGVIPGLVSIPVVKSFCVLFVYYGFLWEFHFAASSLSY